jgi:polysaccharide export outer membrane protein
VVAACAARGVLVFGLLSMLLAGALAFAADGATYTLGPGDAIEISVYQESELSGVVDIGPGGQVDVPLLGQVSITGLTTEGVAALLTERLGAEYLRDPRVTVHVERFGSKKVTLYGAVKQAEVFLERDVSTLEDVLARAGLDATSAQEVQVRRGDEQLTVNLERLLEMGEGNVELRAGDVINLRQGAVVYVNGEVARPSAVPFRDGLTVSQALTSAGGLTDLARQRGAYVLRDEQKIPLNLRRILDGRDEDVALITGDQVIVPEGAF